MKTRILSDFRPFGRSPHPGFDAPAVGRSGLCSGFSAESGYFDDARRSARLAIRMLVSLAAFASVSCEENCGGPDTPEPEGCRVTFAVETDAYPTLPAYGLGGADDRKIALFAAGDRVHGCCAEPLSDTTREAFTGYFDAAVRSGDILYACYPCSEIRTPVTATVRLTIPAEQTQSCDGGFDGAAMPMVAVPVAFGDGNACECDLDKLYFRQLGSVIKMSVYASNEVYWNERIVSVSFRADRPVAGAFDFDLTQSGAERLPAPAGYDSSSVTVRLAEPIAMGRSKSDAVTVYAVVAPGEYGGKITVQTDRACHNFFILSTLEFRRALVRTVGLDVAGIEVDSYENELDLWLKETFTGPYSVEVLYRWGDVAEYTALAGLRLVPIEYDIVEPVMTALRDTWFAPFDAASGPILIKRLAPRNIVLASSPGNKFGSAGLFRTSTGEESLLLNVSGFDPGNDAALRRMLHEVLRDFGSILCRTTMFDNAFRDVSARYYDVSGWQEFDREDRNPDVGDAFRPESWALGFVSNRAIGSAEDDFAEMLSMVCVYGRKWFDEQVCAVAETSATNPNACAHLRSKLAFVESYMRRVWNIRLFDDPADPTQKGLEPLVQAAIARTVGASSTK